MSTNETNDEGNGSRTQAEITREYQYMNDPGRRVAVAVGNTSLRRLMGLSIVDDSNLAAQIRRAVAEYAERRQDDPTFAEQVENARSRFDKERDLAQTALGPDYMPPAEPIVDREEQLPETD